MSVIIILSLTSDPSCIVHSQYELLELGRRYRAQGCKLNLFKNSFVPVSTGILNSSLKQNWRLIVASGCVFLYYSIMVFCSLYSCGLFEWMSSFVCWHCVSIYVKRINLSKYLSIYQQQRMKADEDGVAKKKKGQEKVREDKKVMWLKMIQTAGRCGNRSSAVTTHSESNWKKMRPMGGLYQWLQDFQSLIVCSKKVQVGEMSILTETRVNGTGGLEH